jgi:hemolysin III
MFLDGLPSMLVTVIITGFMWNKVLKSIWKTIGIMALFYLAGITAVVTLRPALGDGVVNLSYLFTGICSLYPAIYFLVKTRFYKWRLLVGSLLLLGLALLFRSLDYPTPNPFPDLLPQGTHFLWHLISALAVFSLGYYLYFIKNIELGNDSKAVA